MAYNTQSLILATNEYVFDNARATISSSKVQWGGLRKTSKITHPRFYLYPTSFIENGEVVYFTYLKMLEGDPTCITYLAKIQTDGHQQQSKVFLLSTIALALARHGTQGHLHNLV